MKIFLLPFWNLSPVCQKDILFTLYLPSRTISSLLFKLRSTFQRVFRALITNSKFCFLLYSSLRLMNEQLRFPESWYTVPPPLFRLTMATSCFWHSGILHSNQGFWCRPITMAGLFLHNNRILSCSKLVLSYSQSSRARFSKIFVDDDTRTLFWMACWTEEYLQARLKNCLRWLCLKICTGWHEISCKSMLFFFSV